MIKETLAKIGVVHKLCCQVFGFFDYHPGPSKPQLFHPQKANGNSFRMCLHDDIGKYKTPKENLEKEKAIIGLFSEVGRPSFIDAHRRPRFKRT